MANRIQGITIEINGDTTKLSKALSSTDKEIKSTQTALRDVEKLLKLDPTNVVLLEQKTKLLSQAIEETKKRLDTLKQAQMQMDENGVDKNSEQYQALQREIIATEQELGKLEKAADNTVSVFDKIAKSSKSLSDATGSLAEKTKGLSLAAGAVVTAIGGAALKVVTLSDDLNTLSAQTGFSTAELQKMSYAADRIDVSMETITGAASRMKRQLDSSEATFKQLGVSTKNVDGSFRDTTDVFYETIDALSKVSNETERDTIAMQLFGRSADQLAGVVDDGGAALRELGDEAEKAGLILSQDTLDGLNVVNDEIDKLKAQTTQILAVNGAKVIEAFLPLINELAVGAGNLAEKFASLDETQIKTIATVAALVAGLSPALKVISGISGIVSTLATALPAVAAALTPVGAIVAGIAGVAAVITTIAVSSRDASLDLKNLTTEARDFADTVTNGQKNLAKTTDEINANAGAARGLVARLKELEKQDLSNAGAAQEYASIVDSLNELYPELNVNIDENTGLIEGGTDAIYRNIQAMQDKYLAEAMQEHYNAVMKEYAEAQTEVYINEYKLQQAIETKAELEEQEEQRVAKLEAAESKYLAVLEQYGEGSEEATQALYEFNKANDESYEEMLSIIDASNQADKEIKAYSKAVDSGKKTLDGYQGTVEEATEVISQLTEATKESTESTGEFSETAEEAESTIQDLSQSYLDLYNDAKKSIDGQVKLFDTFEANLADNASSIEGILDTWAKQTENLAKYTENLRLAAKYGLDEGLIASLSDGSAESAGYLAIMIGAIRDAENGVGNLGDSAQEAVDKINSAFKDTGKAKDNLSTTIAGLNLEMSGAIADADELGRNWVQGLINGMNAKRKALIDTARASANDVKGITKVTLGENSPSKIAKEYGEFWSEGLAIGITNRQNDVEDAAAEVAETIIPTTSTNSSTVNNTSNLGGVFVTVNAAQGQDAQQIAEAVMEEIQAAVEREGAAL